MVIYGLYSCLRALRLFLSGALTLFFLALPVLATSDFDAAATLDVAASESDAAVLPVAAAPTIDTMLAEFTTKMILAVAVLGLLGYAAVKFLPGRWGTGGHGHIKVMGMLNVGRDMIYIVKTGPDVVAFVSGRTGPAVLGRWSLEEWDDYEAAASARDSLPSE
jgi:hypothetical protein